MCALYRIHNTILAFKRPSDLARGSMQTLQVPIYATFLPAIDENQFAQAAKRKRNEKAERQKNKSRTSRTQTTTNWPHATLMKGRGREDTGKLSLKPGCRHTVAIISIANRHISISMPDSGEEIQISAKRDTRQATSEMLNQIKVPATKCKIRQRTRNSNSSRNSRGRKREGEEIL